MGLADDLLSLSEHLASPKPTDPEQVWFRRSVSTTYYALFHLLIEDAVQGWDGSASLRLGLERAFAHDRMKEVSRTVSQGSWKGWSMPPLQIPHELQVTATAFVRLQRARHQADYNNAKEWTKTEVTDEIRVTRNAFQSWREIRSHRAANEYLLSLLVGKKRE
ncbi:MAG: hypothetical protein ACR2NN_07905 [Bryobacteraceae bacterium]